MNMAQSLQKRIAVLIGAVVLLVAGAIPLIGTAQDATPTDGLSDEWLIQEGEAIYNNVCVACHQPDGQGVEGVYLPIANNPLITNEDPTYLISVILTGRGGMPSFANIYTDEEIAAVSTFVRQNWENDAGPVSAIQVAEIREEVIAKPDASPTPIGQRPGGNVEATPEATPQQ